MYRSNLLERDPKRSDRQVGSVAKLCIELCVILLSLYIAQIKVVEYQQFVIEEYYDSMGKYLNERAYNKKVAERLEDN